MGPRGVRRPPQLSKKPKSVIEFQDEDLRERYLNVVETMSSKLLIGETPEFQLEIANDLFLSNLYRDISRMDGTERNPLFAESILHSYSRNICTLAQSKIIYGDVAAISDISSPTYCSYMEALQKHFIIEDVPAWRPSIRSKEAMRAGVKRNLIDPSLAVAALDLTPEYFNIDFKTLGFLFESLCIRDLKIYSSKMRGEMSYATIDMV